MVPDLINGLLEGTGGLFILNQTRALYKTKDPESISTISVAFFTGWGAWNLYYYPSLGQWASLCGGVFMCTCNSLWVAQLIYYRRRLRKKAASVLPPAPLIGMWCPDPPRTTPEKN